MCRLDQLAVGDSGVIETIETDKIPLKLIEMGCLPGNEVTLIQRAPFNDPLYFKIDQAHLAIRVEAARYITVAVKP
ncbi:MAG: FeoA family protein [Flavobacteriaceae bacterium]